MATVEFDVVLDKGENVIRLYNETGWMADIDKMEIVKKGLAEGENEEIVTRIFPTAADYTNAAIYTPQGMRLDGPAESLPEGIYIVGNKKVVVK